MIVIAVLLAVLVGLSLGALGGGGSTLAVPILVFVAGLTVQDATTVSLVVVGVAAVVGVVSHVREGNVRLGPGLAFGAAGIVGSRLGLVVNRSLDEDVLLLAFSVLVVFVAQRMYRAAGRATPAATDAVASVEPEAARSEPADEGDDADELGPTGGRPTGLRTRSPDNGSRVDAAPASTRVRGVSFRSAMTLALAATAVGFLTGVFGVGGGFAVVPALVLLLGFSTREAIGTSLVVIAINAAIALGLRSGDLDIDWSVAGPFLVAAAVGVVLGTRIARGLDADRLTRGFAIMLLAVACFTAVSAVLG